MAKGTSGHIYTGHFRHLNMTRQVGINVAEGGEILNWEETAHGQYRVHGRSAMSLRQNATVTICIMRISGINAHFVEIQDRKDIHDGQRAAKMAGTCCLNHAEGTAAALGRNEFQLDSCVVVHCCSFMRRK